MSPPAPQKFHQRGSPLLGQLQVTVSIKVMASFLSKCDVPEQRQINLKFLTCSGIPFHPSLRIQVGQSAVSCKAS